MTSSELYLKLRGFWARPINGYFRDYDVKAGKRYCFSVHKEMKVWYRLHWKPVLPEMPPNGHGWVRPTYQEFCYGLGLKMIS